MLILKLKSTPLQIFYPCSVLSKITSLYFFSLHNILCSKRAYWSENVLDLQVLGQNLSNSLCQSWNNKLIPLQILYPSSVLSKITPLYIFSSNNIYFAQKEPVKVNIFETFRCSGQNLSNSLSQSWNNKLIPLQILYLSSVLW